MDLRINLHCLHILAPLQRAALCRRCHPRALAAGACRSCGKHLAQAFADLVNRFRRERRIEPAFCNFVLRRVQRLGMRRAQKFRTDGCIDRQPKFFRCAPCSAILKRGAVSRGWNPDDDLRTGVVDASASTNAVMDDKVQRCPPLTPTPKSGRWHNRLHRSQMKQLHQPVAGWCKFPPADCSSRDSIFTIARTSPLHNGSGMRPAFCRARDFMEFSRHMILRTRGREKSGRRTPDPAR